MKVALGIYSTVSEEHLTFAKQLGVNHIVMHQPSLGGDGYLEFLDLLRLRKRIESAGLTLAAIENIPRTYYRKIQLGLPGRDKQIENWCKTLRNMGKAGIPVLGYDWNLVGVWRTTSSSGRGGVCVTSFDYKLVKDTPRPAFDSSGYEIPPEAGLISEQEMWDNYTYFLRKVIPVAEETKVKMALHPDDPPVPTLGGTTRIFRSIDALKRVIEIVPSNYNGIEFCQGTIAEMGNDVLEAIRYFGEKGKIFYVHFRNIKGVVPKFDETFIDEGKVDMFKAMRIYKETGFKGVMRPDHFPVITNDIPWADNPEEPGHVSLAFAIGYMKALIRAVNSI